MQKSKISLIASPKPFAMGHGCPTGKFPFFFHVRVLLDHFHIFFYMKGWQLFYWHVSIILFAMATVHSLWQPLRLMTHWAWTIRIRKHVQTDPHGAKSSIPTGPSSCPEQCGRPWDIQYIFPCLHPTFTTYIIIYIYVCVWFSRSFKTWHPQLQWIIIYYHIIIYYYIYYHIWSYMIESYMIIIFSLFSEWLSLRISPTLCGRALGWPSGRLPIGIPRMLLSLGLCLEIGRWEGFLRALRYP